MIGTQEEVAVQPELEHANDSVAAEENIDAQQEPADESAEGLEADEHTDDDVESDEPDLTPGVSKRIAKLAAKHEREKAELRAELDAKLYQFQMGMQQQFQSPQMAEQQLQQQYQQQFGNQYQQPAYDPNNPYGLQPQVPTFEQFKQWQHKAEMERKQQTEQAEFQQGVGKVLQSVHTKKYQDPEFAELANTYGNLFDHHMLYALKGLKNPGSFLKHVLKREENRAAVRQLLPKNPFERVAELTKWGVTYEAQSQASRPQAATKPKPIQQPKAGGSISARARSGFDASNPATHTKENIRNYMMKGR